MKRLLLSFALAAPLVACGIGDASSTTSEADDTSTPAKPYGGTCTPGEQVCAYFSPTDMPIHAVLDAMRGAQSSIRLATYNMNVPEIAEVVRQKLDAGVKVELMEDYHHAKGDDGDATSVWERAGQHPNLVKYKLPVLRGGTPQMHDKILVVDGQRVFFGSANFTYQGLVGNFENLMAVRDPDVVAKYVAELDELEAFGKLACETFAVDPTACGKGTEKYSPEFDALASNGAFDPAPKGPIDATRTGCAVLADRGAGFLIAGNQPRVADATVLKSCFVDPALGDKYVTFAQGAAAIEKYVDGTAVKADPPTLQHVTLANGRSFDDVRFNHRDGQTGAFRVYFGGEDDLEYKMYSELRALEQNPAESFAYVSTNFMTNSRLVGELAKLHDAGVRVRAFFDRGRFTDPNFDSQFGRLSKLGFSYGLGARKVQLQPGDWAKGAPRWQITRTDEVETEESLANAAISVFDNDLSGNYGCDHDKFAVLGHKDANGAYHVVLVNGSANWSAMAVQRNDENLAIVDDPLVASIYLREMASQLYVFRYAQDENSTGLRDDMAFVSARVPCFDAVLGSPNEKCTDASGQIWRPAVSGALVMAVRDVPAPLDGSTRVWAWVSNWQAPGSNHAGRAFEVFSADTFEGKWVTSIPAAPGTELKYKLLTAPAGVDPNQDLGAAGIQWEYGGVGNDRSATLGSRPLLTIRSSNLHWGAP